MKESLRNFALSAALMTAGAMFAEAPTVTVNFSQKITATEIAALGTDVRVATGANGYVYALNKATGEVYAINGEGIKVLDKTFAPTQGEGEDVIASLNTAITTDDAGNIIALYANGGFWANGPYSLAIMPADGGEIVYTEKLAFPEGYDVKRLDVLGRAVGNVLENGVIYFAPGNGAEAITTAGFVFEDGVPTAMEYCSTALECGGQNLNVAVPAYNSIDEIMDVDAIYDAMYVQQWNSAANFFYVEDGEAMKGAVSVPEGGAVGGAPGFDLINRDGEMYYFSMFRTPELNPGGGSRCANFQMTDAEGNVIFATENVAAEAGTTFINGGGIFVHQVTADKYEVYFWGGPKESVYATMATVNFGAEEGEDLPVVEVDGIKFTTNFSQKVTATEIAALGTEVRVATGANGYVYALNKATGEVYAINGEGIKVLDKTFAPTQGEGEDVIASLNTAITTDDAGNIIALYANGGFWANGPYSLAIMPADGGEIVYTEKLAFPEGYDVKRLDVLGRAVGNVLENGVIYFAPGNGAEAITTAGFVFEDGVPTAMEYCSTALECGGQNLNVAVPAYNSIDEIMDVDAIYDAMYVQQWNSAANFFYVEDGEAMKGAVSVPEGGAVGGAPGFDLINRDGEMYYFSMFRTPELNPGGGSRCANFQVTDAEGKVLFATENLAAEAGTTFINGGGLFVHKVADNKYETYFWGGPKESVYATMVTIEFPAEEVPAYEAPVLGFRGAANEWGFGQVATVEGPDDNGLYTYTLELDELAAGEFKFGTEDWKTSFGAGANQDIVNGAAVESFENGQNFNMPENGVNVKLVLTVNPDYSQASSLLATWEVAETFATRSAFAYALAASKNTDNTYDVTFKATEAGDASLVLTSENAEIVKTLGAATKGENKFNVAFTDEELGEWNWAVRIETENAAKEPEFAVKQIWEGDAQFGRGGIVTLNDPEYDTFGYTLLAASRGLGINVYDPEGNLVKEGLYKDSSLNSANSSPLRGGQRFGQAVFASWADSNSGYYYVDPINPAETPENILVGERAGSGLFTYEGVQTAGGSPCVAFLGEGDNQTMWLFEEDLFANQVAIYPIGTAKQLTVAGFTPSWNTKSAFASTVVCYTPTQYGMFASQNRADGMDAGTPAFIFMSPQGDRLVDAVDMLPAGYTLPSSNGGLAVSNDGTILAVATYNSIEFFTMEWEEQEFNEYDDQGNLVAEKKFTVPCNLEFLYSIECQAAANLNFGQASFDAGNNLHYQAAATTNYYTGVRYAVVTLPGANVATTPAKADSKIEVTTAVESIEAAAAADAVYYNLNGVRVAPENMTAGVYVKVQGD